MSERPFLQGVTSSAVAPFWGIIADRGILKRCALHGSGFTLQADPQADQEDHHHHGLHPPGTCHHVAVGGRSDPWLTFVKLCCLRLPLLQKLLDEDGRDDVATSTQRSALSVPVSFAHQTDLWPGALLASLRPVANGVIADVTSEQRRGKARLIWPE